MKIAILNAQVPFVYGGAEFLAESLRKQLASSGHHVELVTIPFKWYPNAQLKASIEMAKLIDITESAGAKVDLVIPLKFPLFYINHPNKKLWLLHQFRQVYDFYDAGQTTDFSLPQDSQLRHQIINDDTKYLSSFTKRYTISKNVSKRLLKYNGITSEALYPPPPDEHILHYQQADKYFFYPSRLDASKRQDLIIHALAKTKSPVKLLFAGSAPDIKSEMNLKALVEKYNIGDRVKFLGNISNTEKADLYAKCMAVIFTPVDEDLGYVTMEAQISKKPVITCNDTGGVLEFITDGVDGLIASPTPDDLSFKLDTLWNNTHQAYEMGQAGAINYANKSINWDTIIEKMTHD